MVHKTIIHSNGSKWMGESPDSLDKLKERLNKNRLNLKDFAKCGFVSWNDKGDIIKLFGNFTDISGVFNIEGDSDNKELKEIADLIGKNIDRQFEVNLEQKGEN